MNIDKMDEKVASSKDVLEHDSRTVSTAETSGKHCLSPRGKKRKMTESGKTEGQSERKRSIAAEVNQNGPSGKKRPKDFEGSSTSKMKTSVDFDDSAPGPSHRSADNHAKVSVGIATETNETKSRQCKYCMLRLSTLRQLDSLSCHRTPQRGGVSSSSGMRRTIGTQTSASLFESAQMTQEERQSLDFLLGVRESPALRSETFCKCVLQNRERDCRCGEEEKYFEWVWDYDNRGQAASLQEEGRQAVFHKDYSCGTTAVRGQQMMHKDQHFWEIKMNTPVYGTDMMVGIGTKNVSLNAYHNTFCSMLGQDLESWGISYDGRVQNGGRKKDYCSRFGQGTIIGLHLDMWHGTLAFFKNRQSLGVAFTGLRGRQVYPMACSTAARSGMRVICARSFPTSLQYLCCRRLRQFVPPHLSVLDALTMPPGLRMFLANNMTWLLDVPHNVAASDRNSNYVCSICLPLKNVFEGCTKEDEAEERMLRTPPIPPPQMPESDDDSDDNFDVGTSLSMERFISQVSQVASSLRSQRRRQNESSSFLLRRKLEVGERPERELKIKRARLETGEGGSKSENDQDGEEIDVEGTEEATTSRNREIVLAEKSGDAVEEDESGSSV